MTWRWTGGVLQKNTEPSEELKKTGFNLKGGASK